MKFRILCFTEFTPDLLVRSLPTPANTLLRTGLVLEAGAALKLGWTNQR